MDSVAVLSHTEENRELWVLVGPKLAEQVKARTQDRRHRLPVVSRADPRSGLVVLPGGVATLAALATHPDR